MLRWEDVSTPTPGPGEVIVQVHAVSVNRTLDLQVRSGLGAERQEDLERALQLGKSGELKVLIDRLMPLQEAVAAHRLVAQNEPLGKIVLDPTLA